MREKCYTSSLIANIELVNGRKDRRVFHKAWFGTTSAEYLRKLNSYTNFEPICSMQELKSFIGNFPRAHCELASILALWLCRTVFSGREGDLIRPESFLPACKLAWGVPLALCSAMVTRLYFRLRKATMDISNRFNPYEREACHYFYSWIVCLCPDLHEKGGNADLSDPYMCQLATENSHYLTNMLSLSGVRDILWNSRSFRVFHLSSPSKQKDRVYCDFRIDRDGEIKGCAKEHHLLLHFDGEWLQCICSSTLIFREPLLSIMQPYWPSRFALQFGYT